MSASNSAYAFETKIKPAREHYGTSEDDPTQVKREEPSSFSQMDEIRQRLRTFLDSASPSMTVEENDSDTDRLLGLTSLSPNDRSVLNFGGSPALLLENLTISPSGGRLSGKREEIRSEHEILRQGLERERLRRKTCEQKVYELERKVLFSEQQLAVALSVNKKREIMISQLEKTLGEIVGGWQTQETQYKETTEWLQDRNAEIDGQCKSAEKECGQLQAEVHELQARLSASEENLQAMKAEAEGVTMEKSQMIDQLVEERGKVERLLEEKGRFDKKIERERVKKENKILNLENEMKKVKEEQWYLIQEEKEKLANQLKTVKGYQERLSGTQAEIQGFQEECQHLKGQQEGLKHQLNLQQSEHSASLAQQKAELVTHFETRLRDRILEVHSAADQRERDIRREYESQLRDIKQAHSGEVKQVKFYWEKDLADKEGSFQDTCRDYEERLRILTEMLREEREMRSKMEKSNAELSEKLRALIELQCQQSVELVEELINQHGDDEERSRSRPQKPSESENRRRQGNPSPRKEPRGQSAEKIDSMQLPAHGSTSCLHSSAEESSTTKAMNLQRDEDLRSYIETLLHRFPGRPLTHNDSSRLTSSLFSPLSGSLVLQSANRNPAHKPDKLPREFSQSDAFQQRTSLFSSPSDPQSANRNPVYFSPKSDKSSHIPRETADEGKQDLVRSAPPTDSSSRRKVRRNLETKYPKTQPVWK